MDNLIKILRLTESELKSFLYEYLLQMGMKPISDDGFLYAKGEIPILLVAHMDTVLKSSPKDFYYDDQQDILFSKNGIGGDDRCGIYAIMEILKNFKPFILFTEEEEIGGIGASKAVRKLERPNIKFMIELDRKGNNDCVFYGCDNKKFIDFIESFGFVKNKGSFSDICVLGEFWDVAAVNLSCGYYNAHSKKEYIKFKELLTIIERVKGILQKNYENIDVFSYKEPCLNNYFNRNLDELVDYLSLFKLEFPGDEKGISLVKRKNDNDNKRGK